MELNRRFVEVFQVASFLIINHGYRFVSLKQNEDELWLGNPTNMEFPVIRVSCSRCESVYFDKNRILEIHHMVCKLLKREARLLDIHVTDEMEVESSVDIEQLILRKEIMIGKDITYYFPLIKRAITPFDDVKEEFARLNREMEEYQAQKSKQKKQLKQLKGIKMTYVVMAVCILFFVLIHLLNITMNYKLSSASIALGAYYRNFIIMHHQYWRFLTIGLTHIDLWHVVMNMYSLYILGTQIEEVYGQRNFLIILCGSTIAGSVFTFIADSTVLAVGISGGLYGLIAAFLIFAYTKKLFNIPSFRTALVRTLFLNVLINFMPSVGVMAHLGGFLGGLILGFILSDYPVWAQVRRHGVVAAVVLSFFFGYRIFQVNQIEQHYILTDNEVIQIYKDFKLDDYAEKLQRGNEKFYDFNR